MTALLVASACALIARIVAEVLLRRAGWWPDRYDWPRWVRRVRRAMTTSRRRGAPHDTMRVRPRAYTRTTTPQPLEHP